MNEVKLKGTLTKAPYYADKGWAAATLSVQRKGTTFSLWVPLYFPANVAGQLKTFKTMQLEVSGELDQTKDKKMQVKVSSVAVADGITDEDIPF